MLYNYLKITWRGLLQNKTLSFINIFGLALGMAFAMLIGMWIQYEGSFDTFNKNRDRIAFVGRNLELNNEKSTAFSIMLPLYDELKSNYPEIKRITRYDWGNTHSLMIGSQKFNKKGAYVDPEFLHMFTFPLVKGNTESALKDPNSIVLTQSLATAIFGAQDPIGKIIKVDNQHSVTVTAVAQDAPKNSTLDFEFLAPFDFKIQNNEAIRNEQDHWANNFLGTIVELNEGASMEALSKKIGPLLAQKETGVKNQRLFLFPMAQWHLYDDFDNWVNTGGRIEYVRLFGIIGIFVLLIACINFMNLTTARSEKRAREVGVRKAVGSQRTQLISQFLTESLTNALLAFFISILLIKILLPNLKDIGFEHIHFDLNNIPLLASMLAVCVLTGLISGSYPALYLSSFLPAKVLKGPVKQGSEAVKFRKVLVVSQFTISIGLIISTIIVYEQINHAKNRPTGYTADNLITLSGNEDLARNFNILKHSLLNSGVVESVAKASSPLTRVGYDYPNFSWDGKDPNTDISLDVVLTEWDYEKAARLQFVEGRPFSRAFTTDSNAVILNEAALKLIGYKDPVGKTMKLGDRDLTIVGIIKNVLMRDPFKPVSPAVILFDAKNINVVLVRMKDQVDMQKALATTQPIVEKYNPAQPFEYRFVDEEFGKKFTTENQIAKLAGTFAGVAIFISFMGLFGLATFMAERRSKEISIRKVLGATAVNLWVLLSQEFIWLLLIAWAVASSLALWFMTRWLEKYEYRIDIGWQVFAVAGSLAIVIALVTVSTQTVRAALANPGDRLRAE